MINKMIRKLTAFANKKGRKVQREYKKIAEDLNFHTKKMQDEYKVRIISEKLLPTLQTDNERMDEVLEEVIKKHGIDKRKAKLDQAIKNLFAWGLSVILGCSEQAQQAFFMDIFIRCRKIYNVDIPSQITLTELFNLSNIQKPLENILIEKIMEFNNEKDKNS